MRQARFKRNRGVYKCHTFGTLQHYLQMARFINLQMLGIFSICSEGRSDCGDNQARPTVIDSRSILAGVQGFESLSPHSSISFINELIMIAVPGQST